MRDGQPWTWPATGGLAEADPVGSIPWERGRTQGLPALGRWLFPGGGSSAALGVPALGWDLPLLPAPLLPRGLSVKAR